MHDEEGTSSKIKIFGNIFISFIGAGILGLPYAFKEAGLIEGIAVMTLVGIICVKAMLLLIDCKDRIVRDVVVSQVPDNHKNQLDFVDYGEIGFVTFGSLGKFLVDSAIVVSQIGFDCSYLIFISENIYSVVPYFPKMAYVIIMLFPLAFLCNLRHLKSLAPFSLFADFANIFAYSIVFWFDLEHFHLLNLHFKTISLKGLPFFLGIAIYCYEGAGMVISLEQSVVKESRGTIFRSVFKFALFVVTLLYNVFGVLGYLSFGPHTESIITLNLPLGPFPLIVKSCLCLSLLFTYPVMMFPVSLILERKLSHIHVFSERSHYSYISGCILRTSLVLLTGIIVLLIPNFSILMALVGSSCCTLLALILPALFHIKLFKKELKHYQLLLDGLMICMGIIGSIIGMQDALDRIFTDKTTGITNNNSTS